MKQTWGLHLFKSPVSPGLYCASYFVERPYASLLVFPPSENSLNNKNHFEFLENKGGVAFLFHLYQDRPNPIQKELYNRFGPPLICPWEDETFAILTSEDKNFRYGKFGEDFYDHQVEFGEIKGFGYEDQELASSPMLVIRKKGTTFLFLGAPWIYDRGQIRYAPTGKAVSQIALLKGQITIKNHETYFIFQFFRGLNWCSAEGVVS